MRLLLSIELLQDAAAPVRPQAGNVEFSADHLPASVIRGALATAWIRTHGLPASAALNLRNQFENWFEQGGIGVGPALPIGHVFQPMYVQFCKYLGTEACASVAVDTAFADDDAEQVTQCPECDGPLAYGKGKVIPLSSEVASPGLVHRTRVEIGDDGVAEDGQLFTEERIPAGTELLVSLRAEGDASEWLHGLHGTTAWFGANRSTQGMAMLSVEEQAEPPASAERTDGRVLVRLESPAVLLDHFGANQLTPTAGDIVGAANTGAVIVQQWVRHQVVGGWHAASGLPRPLDTAIAAGSAFLLEGVGLDAARDECASGIGVRRAEGLGQVTVNPPRFELLPSEAVEEAHHGPGDDDWIDRKWTPADIGWLVEHIRSRQEQLHVARTRGEAPPRSEVDLLDPVRVRSFGEHVATQVRKLLASESIDGLSRVRVALERTQGDH